MPAFALINNKKIKLTCFTSMLIANEAGMDVDAEYFDIIEEDHGHYCDNCGNPAMVAVEGAEIVHLCKRCFDRILGDVHREIVEMSKQISKIREEVALK